MKSQSWRNQPYHWWFWIQFDAREIPVTLKIAFTLMTPHSQPIIDSLNRQLNIFGCFQLDHNQPSMLCDAEQIDYAAVSRSERGDLRIQVFGNQMRIKSGGILQDQSLQPAF